MFFENIIIPSDGFIVIRCLSNNASASAVISKPLLTSYASFGLILPFLSLHFEYSLIYLFLVPIFYYFRNNGLLLSISFILFYLNYLIYPVDSFSIATFFTILCLPFILVNTDITIKINKFFFYLYYPIHIIILLIIKYLL